MFASLSSHEVMKKSGFSFFSNLFGIYSKSNVTTSHKKCQARNIMLPKFTIWYNCSASSFAFKMVSEGGRGSFLNACYQSKRNTSLSSSVNLRTDAL